jgi:hypothetical protein
VIGRGICGFGGRIRFHGDLGVLGVGLSGQSRRSAVRDPIDVLRLDLGVGIGGLRVLGVRVGKNDHCTGSLVRVGILLVGVFLGGRGGGTHGTIRLDRGRSV